MRHPRGCCFMSCPQKPPAEEASSLQLKLHTDTLSRSQRQLKQQRTEPRRDEVSDENIKTKATVGKPDMKHCKIKGNNFLFSFPLELQRGWATFKEQISSVKVAFNATLVAFKLCSGHFQNSQDLLLVC